MNYLQTILNPITLTFLIIIIGYYIGKIKFFGISLDLAMVLISAVLTGWLVNLFPFDNAYFINMQSYMKMFSSLGTGLFISIIGILTGYSLTLDNKRKLAAIITGFIMVISAVISMLIISVFDENISISSLMGILCGALTSTPGLSTICDSETIVSNDAVLGYSNAYTLGVVITVIFIQILMRYTVTESFETLKETNETNHKANFGAIIQIGIAVVLGSLFGNIKIPIIDFSLGNSGGILCCGVLLGYIIQRHYPTHIVDRDILGLLRNFGLVLFFVGTGFPAGINIENGLNTKSILYGIILTIIPIIVGYIISKVFLLKPQLIISGGMTSTPAIGLVLQKVNRTSLTEYSYSYVGALVTIILLMRIISNY